MHIELYADLMATANSAMASNMQARLISSLLLTE
jgi:hypothetical protein